MSATENLFDFEQIRVNDNVETTLIFEEIYKELEEYLLEKSNDADSTDGVFDFLDSLSAKIQEKFDKLLEGDSDKIVYQGSDVYFCFVIEYKGRHCQQSQANT